MENKQEVLDLVSAFKELIKKGQQKESVMGEQLDEMLFKKVHLTVGYKTYASFVKTEFGISKRTANRYISKFKLRKAFALFGEKIDKATLTICDIFYSIYVNAGREFIEKHMEEIHHTKVKDAYKLLADSKKDKTIRDERISFALTKSEFIEFKSFEEDIQQAFDLKSRKDVVLEAMRGLYTEAQQVIANQAEEG